MLFTHTHTRIISLVTSDIGVISKKWLPNSLAWSFSLWVLQRCLYKLSYWSILYCSLEIMYSEVQLYSFFMCTFLSPNIFCRKYCLCIIDKYFFLIENHCPYVQGFIYGSLLFTVGDFSLPDTDRILTWQILFQSLNNTVPFPSGLHGLQWEILCLWNSFPFRCGVISLSLTSRLSFVGDLMNLMLLFLCVKWFALIMFVFPEVLFLDLYHFPN